VDSCPALDANALAVRGCLRPGGSGIYPWAGGNGVIIASIRFHCEAGRLYLSYATPADGERTEIISISRVTYRSGARHSYFLCPGAGCGRRVFKLYRSRGRFLCRHCSGLVYASNYYEEHPWQRAFRRAAKLRRRLGVTGRGAPDKPKGMPVSAYERLLEAMLQAETEATEAGTARLLQLIDQLKPRFTLD
jgi:hypothetical protein